MHGRWNTRQCDATFNVRKRFTVFHSGGESATVLYWLFCNVCKKKLYKTRKNHPTFTGITSTVLHVPWYYKTRNIMFTQIHYHRTSPAVYSVVEL